MIHKSAGPRSLALKHVGAQTVPIGNFSVISFPGDYSQVRIADESLLSSLVAFCVIPDTDVTSCIRFEGQPEEEGGGGQTRVFRVWTFGEGLRIVG